MTGWPVSRLVGRAMLVAACVGSSIVDLVAARAITSFEPAERLAEGTADGMAVTGRGRLFLAPRISGLGGSQTPDGPVQVWAMATDGDGHVVLGTGPEGQILEIGPSGEPRVRFTVAEPMVTALAFTPDGDLLAGCSPGGTIYRIDREGRGEPWTTTEERYVWVLAVDERGSVLAGTGERGRIVSIGPAGDVDVLFDSDESHVISLVPLADGGVLAGGAGRGLVYRIDAEGHALVLHDDELSEVAALAADDDGAVVAALVASPEPAARRPALKLRLPDGVQVGTTDEAVGSLEESQGPVLHGTIEGLVAPDAGGTPRAQGRIVRIDPNGVATELWSSTQEVPFCLAQDAHRRILFGTGEPARLYRVEDDGDVALLATLREAQLTELLLAGRSMILATSNPAAAYRLHEEPARSGSFLSRPFDAGGTARWGSIRWHVERPSGRTEIYTRTGNTREPDDTWSAWSPALTEPAGSTVVNPDGRFLQWRLRQAADGRPATRVDRISFRYEPYNRVPALGDVTVDAVGPDARDTRTFHCTVSDPDGDPVVVSLEIRPVGETAWAVVVLPSPGNTAEARREIEWDTRGVPEGEYEVRLVASDQPGNPRGEGLVAIVPHASSVVVDRTPPRMEVEPLGGGAFRVTVEDDLSPIERLEVLADGRTRFAPRSVDGVCDSTRETFRVESVEAGVGWTLRGIDAAGNRVETSLAAEAASN